MGVVHIHSDSLLALGVASDFIDCVAHPALAAAVRALAQHRQACQPAQHAAYLHVKAHSGHPWNELADWLASENACHLPQFDPGWRLPRPLEPTMLEWALWVLAASGSEGPAVAGQAIYIAPSFPPVLDPELTLATDVTGGPPRRRPATSA